jgi:L-alanine-DL-glutamate epimerase-like enolase superfamily enzyme
MAAARDVAVAPHWVPEAHIYLAAASPNVLALEYFHEHVGILNFEKLLAVRLEIEDGEVVVPERPGHGILFDPEAVAHFEVKRG